MKAEAVAILVAGGSGTRFGGAVRKQYLKLGAKPVLWWSLKAFEKAKSFAAIIVVVPAEDVESVRKFVKGWAIRKSVSVVAGGASRRESVAQGLKAVPPGVEWVAVHDAVRPLIQPETIEQVLFGARSTGAAIASSPSRDTVKIADERLTIASTPARERVWLAQTPQIFRRDLLERAHASSPGLTATDDAQLVEAIGGAVRLVEAPADNIKVTVPMDLEIAKLVLKGRERSS